MDREGLAKTLRTASEQATGYCPATEIDWHIVADAALSYFREYLGREDVVEAVAEAAKAALLDDDESEAYMRHDDNKDYFLIDGYVRLTPVARAALNAAGGKQDG